MKYDFSHMLNISTWTSQPMNHVRLRPYYARWYNDRILIDKIELHPIAEITPCTIFITKKSKVIRESLRNAGYKITRSPEKADVIVISGKVHLTSSDDYVFRSGNEYIRYSGNKFHNNDGTYVDTADKLLKLLIRHGHVRSNTEVINTERC